MEFKTPKGTYDLLGNNLKNFELMKEKFGEHVNKYGYKKIETPVFESTGVFKRESDTSDMVNKEMYLLDEDKFALRPEGTAGVVRSFVENKLYVEEMPYKLFYTEKMYRKERPQKGRQREFTQMGVECFGDKNPMIDAEIIAMGYNFITSLGIKGVKVLINTLGDEASRLKYRNVLHDYFDTAKESLCEDCVRRIETNPLRILDCKVDNQNPIVVNAPKIADYLTDESKEYFEKVKGYLDALDIPYAVEDRLVRGLDYYTDTVFEVVSTNEASGAQSTIFGGGRYDHLVEYFGAPPLSGIGFGMGLERLLILAEAEGILDNEEESIDSYIIDLSNGNPYVMKVANMLRNEGLTVIENVYPRKMKAQFKSVDRYHAKTVIIVGDDEISNNVVNIKNIETQVQITVNFDEIVKTVKEMVGR